MTFLQLQPGTVFLLVEKLFRGVSKSMHASRPVHSERLHDRDDPRVLAQPSGGKHAPVDVLRGREYLYKKCICIHIYIYT